MNLQKTTLTHSYINISDKQYDPSYYEDEVQDNNLEEDEFIW